MQVKQQGYNLFMNAIIYWNANTTLAPWFILICHHSRNRAAPSTRFTRRESMRHCAESFSEIGFSASLRSILCSLCVRLCSSICYNNSVCVCMCVFESVIKQLMEWNEIHPRKIRARLISGAYPITSPHAHVLVYYLQRLYALVWITIG